MKIVKIRNLKGMPLDSRFHVTRDDGVETTELCHATGVEVYDGEQWWNEYYSTIEKRYLYGR